MHALKTVQIFVERGFVLAGDGCDKRRAPFCISLVAVSSPKQGRLAGRFEAQFKRLRGARLEAQGALRARRTFEELLPIVAQPFEFEDGHPAILEPQQTFLFQPLQALVGNLPGDARERSDFLLGDLEMPREVRIENGIEQRGDRARQTCGRIERAAIFERPMNWPRRSLSCLTRKRLNPTLFSNSQTKVPRFIIASRVSATPPRRSAGARSSAPSPRRTRRPR